MEDLVDQDVWHNILDSLKNNISPEAFKTWFAESMLVEMTRDMLVVYVPSQFASDYMNDNYSEMCCNISDALYKKRYRIKFTNNQVQPNIVEADKQIKREHNLNPKYTFGDFVVGKNNNFAHSAALAVAESPARKYNPLFLYGESGMGKTHLMQAIGHYLLDTVRNINVYYITAEQFKNDMVDAIMKNTTQQFRNKFRNVDLLLVDDIHFMSNKEATQEEFFHTFNTLYENKKQIVITSDRQPKDIPELENRLVTRFQWGLLADLKNPDFETRVAILKKKAISENIILIEDVVEFIAEHITTNVRLLEGSLLRILAFCSCHHINPESLDKNTVIDILGDMIVLQNKEITMDTVFQKVCRYYNITPAQMLDKTRKSDIALPRQIAMYLSSLLISSMSLKDIATYYRRNDHTTVIHAKKMIEHRSQGDNNFREEIGKLIQEIRGL